MGYHAYHAYHGMVHAYSVFHLKVWYFTNLLPMLPRVISVVRPRRYHANSTAAVVVVAAVGRRLAASSGCALRPARSAEWWPSHSPPQPPPTPCPRGPQVGVRLHHQDQPGRQPLRGPAGQRAAGPHFLAPPRRDRRRLPRLPAHAFRAGWAGASYGRRLALPLAPSAA